MLALLAASPAAFAAVALLLGLIVGSFLNVVVYRLPIMLERQWRAECAELSAAAADVPAAESAAPQGGSAPSAPRFNLAVPRSVCPSCSAPIKAIHNIPILSYLALRGRCANCHARISLRYPAVELACGLATAAVAVRFGVHFPAACAAVVSWFLLALAMIDLDTQLLPDSMTLPLLWGGILASLSGWTLPGVALPVDPRSAIMGAAAGYLFLWSVYHVFRLATGKEGMGYGDFKLLGALGAWLGWQMLLPIVLLSALVGALIGGALILSRRTQRGNPMPFGPFLAAAGWVAMMWGPQLVARYLGLYAHPG
ncbi:MAG TPA: A24 family peptidase [Steroidobacteraceae bacterium]|nr:A24 family peptidase [Steroidobacteraceae bacterium]